MSCFCLSGSRAFCSRRTRPVRPRLYYSPDRKISVWVDGRKIVYIIRRSAIPPHLTIRYKRWGLGKDENRKRRSIRYARNANVNNKKNTDSSREIAFERESLSLKKTSSEYRPKENENGHWSRNNVESSRVPSPTARLCKLTTYLRNRLRTGIGRCKVNL